MGTKFEIVTDQRALKHLKLQSNVNQQYVLDSRPDIASKAALFEKDAAYQMAAKAPRAVNEPVVEPAVASVPQADRQYEPRTSQPVAQSDSSDNEEQMPEVIRDAVDIAEGRDRTDNSSDSSGAQTPDAVRRATAIAEGHDVTLDDSFESVRGELEHLGLDDPLEVTREEMERLGLSSLQQSAEELLVVLLRPDAKVPVRKHADDVGFDVAAVDAGVLAKGQITMVPLGIAAQLPVGTFIKIESRSIIAKNGIFEIGRILDC
ncbi:hypothetical protein H4S08_002884 [Coemansia sp. RSA 1365]|nr:hypothetical protein H4S08_002884 [Coemansia sp. RSA 1365]